MKTKLNLIQIWLLGAVLLALPARGQFTNLYNFTGGSDGGNLNAGVILSGDTLYGAADSGGDGGNGTVFALGTNGSGFNVLQSFAFGNGNNDPDQINSDGDQPFASLVLSGDTLYGTAYYGGSYSNGVVYGVNTNGTGGFAIMHTFSAGYQIKPFGFYTNSLLNPDGIIPYTNSDGGNSQSALVSSGNTLFGTAQGGGSTGDGAVFAVNLENLGFTNLHDFTALKNNTNSEGVVPHGGLVLSGNTLYGTAALGGSGGNGAVFALHTDGTGYTNLHNFAAGTGSFPKLTNSSGANPEGTLVLSGGTLYGTTFEGGTNGTGTVFAINTNGTGYTNIHVFAATAASGDNSSGANPVAGLALFGNTLYGTAYLGGANGNGAVFALHTDGTGFTNLYSFSAADDNGYNNDGANPYNGVIVSGNVLYGTAKGGGTFGQGTAFSISLPPVTVPRLAMTPSGANFIFTWPVNAAGFTLQSSTNLDSAVAWGAVSPGPVVVDGQNTVTNPISGAQKFYRLSQ